MEAIRIVEFVEWLPEGHTRPFKAKDSNGHEWVVKSLRQPDADKALVSELVGGSIANWMRLPWPTTSPATLDGSVLDRFKQDFPRAASDRAVAIAYLPDLQPIPRPQRPLLTIAEALSQKPRLQEELAEERELLSKYLSPANVAALYGRSTLDNWLLSQDGKSDQLQLVGDRFTLLDASASLGGISWSIFEQRMESSRDWPEKGHSYSGKGVANYMRAVIDRPEPYEAWLRLVKQYPKEHLETALSWAKSWTTPQRLDLVRSLVLDTGTFVERFRGALRAVTWATSPC
jgi:hypothetical protein